MRTLGRLAAKCQTFGGAFNIEVAASIISLNVILALVARSHAHRMAQERASAAPKAPCIAMFMGGRDTPGHDVL
jgi:hypothetical protein